MEAMACNLPVITTKFGGLTRLFAKGGDGLLFIETENELFDALEILKNDKNVRTRDKVLTYSWKNIGIELEKIYKSQNIIGDQI